MWYRLDCVDERCPTYRVNYWKRPMLGVQVVDITEELGVHFGAAKDEGLLISKVYAGSPAERAGVETGDVIVAVDGEAIDTASDIRKALEGESGRTVDVEVIHDGRAVSLVAEIPNYDL